jgi:hypothetical protein
MPTKADGETATEDLVRLLTIDISSIFDRDEPPKGKTWWDHLVDHLRVAASVEHALMVQYLFAAYSLNPDAEANRAERSIIARWQNLLLSVAKEEMGHLLTVQNVLCLLGAPVALMRDYQIPDHHYTTGFKLEPLTLDSVQRYAWAEAPEEKSKDKSKDYSEQISAAGDPRVLELLNFADVLNLRKAPPGTLHVGALYRDIIRIMSNPKCIPDSAFQADNFRFQASWDDWGRGYSLKAATHGSTKKKETTKESQEESNDDPRREDADYDMDEMKKTMEEIKDDPRRANVIIDRIATRTQAKAALNRIFEQGEAARTVSSASHFYRFFSIHAEFDSILEEKKKAGKTDWRPTHRVVENPHTLPSSGKPESLITWSRSRKWADLFDLRYHMLLSYLSHTFKLACEGSDARLRGAVIHKVFAEMYNLKAIAGILVQLPLTHPDDPPRAGPPFSIPKSLELPTEAIERWRLHDDLVRRALDLNGSLRTDLSIALADSTGTRGHELAYVRTLQSLDKETANWIKQVMVGLSLEMRRRS